MQRVFILWAILHFGTFQMMLPNLYVYHLPRASLVVEGRKRGYQAIGSMEGLKAKEANLTNVEDVVAWDIIKLIV